MQSRIRFPRWTVIACLLACTHSVIAQLNEPAFRRALPGPETNYEPGSRHPGVRAQAIETAFFESDGWMFHHSVEDLPADLRKALEKTLGRDVIGPGEPFDLSDAILYPGRAQHLYTATTRDLGVIVWHTGGAAVFLHTLIYDRNVGDACEYNFGENDRAALPLRPDLRGLVQYRGLSQNGCKYLSPSVLE